MGEYYPYHYVRSDVSMIGSYDMNVFEKIERCFTNKYAIANKYGYLYVEQIDADYMSTYLLYIKKEICRYPSSVNELIDRLKKLRNSECFLRLEKSVSIRKYTLSTRIFAELFINKQYVILICITKFINKVNGRNV
jgi:hypothetical protein